MDGLMRGALVALLTLLSVTDGHAQQALAGAWTGTAFQLLADGRTTSWTINMRIDAQGNATSIDYPTLNCGGSLTYLRAIGDIREYRETLSYGLQRCTNNGTVGFRQKLGKLIWYWSGEGTKNPTGIDVAVLSRATQ
jgi:hypothetical protein